MIDKLVPREFKSDQDERLTPMSVYIDGLNISLDTDEDGNAGVVKTCKGTNQLTIVNPVYDNGETVQVIGSCRDNERGRTYFFVFCSTEAKNAIFYYDDSQNSIELLISGSFLNFDRSKKISCDVVNGEFRKDGEINSLLYFTDDKNEPRKINVDHVDELEGLSDARLELYTAVLKQSPHQAPVVSFSYDSNLGVGSISDESAYQFAFQYVYKDGEISSLSPTSVSYVAERDSDGVFPNHAVVTMTHVMYSRGGDTPIKALNPEVAKIRVLYKEETSVEVSPFRILDEYDPDVGIERNVGSTQNYEIAPEGGSTYVFLDKGYQGVLPSVQEDTPSSAVPRISKTQSVSNSRLFYGNYVEGFNNLGEIDGIQGDSGDKPDVEITVNYADASSALSESVALIPTVDDHNTAGVSFVDQDLDLSSFPDNYNNGDVFNVSIKSGVRVLFNDSEIFENVEARTAQLDQEGTISYSSGPATIDFPVYHRFSIGGQLGFQVCTVDNPIQYSVPINGSYTKEEVIDVLNDFFEENPITRTEVVTLQNSNITNIDGYTTVDFIDFVGTGGIYQAGALLPTPTSSSTENRPTTYWTEFQALVDAFENDPSGNNHPFVNAKIRVRYKVRLQLYYDSSNDDFDYRLIPTSPELIEMVGSNQNFFYRTGSVDSQFSNTGGNILQYNIENTVQADTEMSVGVDASISGFTAGSNHSFAFAYYDNKGRLSSAQEVGSVYVDALGGPDRLSAGEYKNGPATISFTPDHTPPAWASGYRLLYAGPDDVKDSVDLFIDHPTKVIRETKFFRGIPDTVFCKISGFVDALRSEGIEFNQIYNVEEGDVLRIVSRRTVTENGSYIAGNGTGNGIENPHTIADSMVFFDEINIDQETTGTIDFEVVGITEISANTSLEDYPFLLNPDGTVDGGIFLELKVDSNEEGWGKDRILSIEEFVGLASNLFQDTSADAITRTNYQNYLYDETNSTGLLHPDDSSDYVGDEEAENIRRRAYREQYEDASLTTGTGLSNRKYLQNVECWWDKGVRAQLIKPQKRTASKVYHEIGEFRSFISKDVADGPHGPSFDCNKGFARFRNEFSSNVNAFGNSQIRTELLPGADGSGDGFRFLGGNPFSVRPDNNNLNFTVESERCSAGSLLKANHIGRLNVATPDVFEERRQSSIIHSGFQGSETLTLALHDFASTNFKDMDVRYGSINALIAAGQYLNAFQSSKVSRIPINRSILATAGGDNNLTASNTVMGSEMSFEGDYGLDTDITGVIKVDGSMYFIDKSRRAILKISQNGFLPISDIDISRKIESTFIDALETTENFCIGYDKESKEVLFTFIPFDGFDGETYAYDHKKSKWVTRYGFTPTAYIEGRNDVISSRWPSDSLINVHDNEDARAEFYGTAESSKITCISTSKNPSLVKIYNAVGLESNAPASLTISNTDQSVDISSSRFTKKERSYYASIPFDGSHLTKVYGLGNEFHPGDLTEEQFEGSVLKGNVRPVGVVSDGNNIGSGNIRLGVDWYLEPVTPESTEIVVLYWRGKWIPMWSIYIMQQNATSESIISNNLKNSTGSADDDGITVSINDFLHANLLIGFAEEEDKTVDYSTPSNTFSGLPVGYAKLTTEAIGSETEWGDDPYPTTIGGDKIRDHYAKVELTSAGDGSDFELYSINIDVDDSKYHM